MVTKHAKRNSSCCPKVMERGEGREIVRRLGKMQRKTMEGDLHVEEH